MQEEEEVEVVVREVKECEWCWWIVALPCVCSSSSFFGLITAP